MGEKRELAPHEIELQEALKESGIPVHAGGFFHDPFWHAMTRMPVVAIWHESDIPTREEIDTLAEIAREKISKFPSFDVRGITATGVNMLTFRKTGENWTFRRMTWTHGPLWFPEPVSLSELREKKLI